MKMIVKYTTILFDADGTLFDFDKAEEFALKRSFYKFGLEFLPRYFDIYHSINSLKWSQLERGEISKDELQTSRFAELFVAIGERDINIVDFAAGYLDFLADGTQLINGAFEVCRGLSANKTIAIITNGVERTQRRRLSKSKIAPFIFRMFVSEQIGYSKPSVEYFDYVFKEMGLDDKSSVLVVGDSLTSDIQGGINYGLDTCFFNPHGNIKKQGVSPTYEISEITELIEII